MSEPHDAALVVMSSAGTEAERQAAVKHVLTCPDCQAALAQLGRAVDALETATVGRDADALPAGSTARLLQRVGGRLPFFADVVAELFDLPLPDATALLERAERGEGWEAGPAPGVELLVVNAGPKVPEAMTALVRLAPGAEFPEHPHFGDETVVVLEGGYRDTLGTEVWRGETHRMKPDTAHAFTAFDGVGCICASVHVLIPG